MKNYILFILTMITLSATCQTFGTTDDGKKVKLNADGTWEYLLDAKDESLETSNVYIGEKMLISGVREFVHQGDNSYSNGKAIDTYISIAKDDSKTLIIFWQETSDCFFFPSTTWTGNVILYLENGQTISLIDRNLNGHNKIQNGARTNYGSTTDLCQRFAAFYLTSSECLKLKSSNLSRISYKLTDPFQQGTIFMDIQSSGNTIMTQLKAIGR